MFENNGTVPAKHKPALQLSEHKHVTRRQFLFGIGGLSLLALVPGSRLDALSLNSPSANTAGRFLTAHELDTLRVVTGIFIPGPPDDPNPGAVEAGCAEAIDLLLGAFNVNPPLIHAGGPFSNRAGSPVDDMAKFVPLDSFAELGWRIRIEGSKGIPKREFNGPVTGLQQSYRSGLGILDKRAKAQGASDFLHLTRPSQTAVLANAGDTAVQGFVAVVLDNLLEAMYGPPEYGGNRNLAGWTTNNWPGDTQPRGFTGAQVTGAGSHPLTAADFAIAEQILGPVLSQLP